MQFPSRRARVALLTGVATLGIAGTASAASTSLYDVNTKVLAIQVSGTDRVEVTCDDDGFVEVDGEAPARTDGGATTSCANPTSITVDEAAGTTDGNLVDLRGVKREDYTSLAQTTMTLGRGADTMRGSEVADTMIWNPGDGSDVMNGGDGKDTVLDNGGGGDEQFVVKPKDGDPTRVDASRINNPFTLDIDAENLVVNGNGGNDTITGSDGLKDLIKLTINGGDGNDIIVGGDGNDVANGDAGNDDVKGAKGNDTMNGGAGDDVLTWSPGEGTDVFEGGDGNDTAVDNGGGGAEHFIVSANGQRVTATRDTPAPFFLDMGTIETLNLNANGGDDRVEIENGLGALIKVNALLGDGNDTIEARNGAVDTIDGGAGTDSAQADANDAISNVESVDTGAGAGPGGDKPKVDYVSKRLKVKRGKAKLKITCPEGAEGCDGRARILVRGKVAGKIKIAMEPGETKTYRIGLKRKYRVMLARDDDGKLRATVKVRAKDADGTVGRASKKLNLVR